MKMDVAFNNLQRLICHKTQTTNQPINQPSKRKITFWVLEIWKTRPGHNTEQDFSGGAEINIENLNITENNTLASKTIFI